MANGYLEKCSTSVAIREVRLKTTWNLSLVRRQMTTDGTKDMGKEEPLFTSVGKVNLDCTMEISMKFSKKKNPKNRSTI